MEHSEIVIELLRLGAKCVVDPLQGPSHVVDFIFDALKGNSDSATTDEILGKLQAIIDRLPARSAGNVPSAEPRIAGESMALTVHNASLLAYSIPAKSITIAGTALIGFLKSIHKTHLILDNNLVVLAPKSPELTPLPIDASFTYFAENRHFAGANIKTCSSKAVISFNEMSGRLRGNRIQEKEPVELRPGDDYDLFCTKSSRNPEYRLHVRAANQISNAGFPKVAFRPLKSLQLGFRRIISSSHYERKQHTPYCNIFAVHVKI